MGEVAQFGRNRAGEVVATEVQPIQPHEVTQVGWNPAGEIVVHELQFRHPALAVNDNAEPIPRRRVREPVGIVGPARSAGRIVEDLEDVAIRRRPAGDPRALKRRNGVQPALEGSVRRRAELGFRVPELDERQPGQAQRQSARELFVIGNPQHGHSGHVAQRCRKASGQAVVLQVKFGHVAEGIRGDAVPLFQRIITHPAIRLIPADSGSPIV